MIQSKSKRQTNLSSVFLFKANHNETLNKLSLLRNATNSTLSTVIILLYLNRRVCALKIVFYLDPKGGPNFPHNWTKSDISVY